MNVPPQYFTRKLRCDIQNSTTKIFFLHTHLVFLTHNISFYTRIRFFLHTTSVFYTRIRFFLHTPYTLLHFIVTLCYTLSLQHTNCSL